MQPSALSVSLALGLVILPQASQGQRIASLTAFPAQEAPARRYPATYYLEGAVIGTSVLATTGAWFGAGLCESSDCTGATVSAALLFGLLGGTAGAIVGGFFPAPHPRPLRGHAARAALLGAIAGALWGFGVFTHFCLNGCNSGEVTFGASSAAVGALAGVVVGL